ncbi:hypothetical protein ACFSO7_02755 [Bacillus sp. CGMCC 1.16607]|uniref:hypothetical protein n=1 Tax=Bacillus sp. CGMCC 1.16607 TaxID=3351842 RepID=UPI0036449B35
MQYHLADNLEPLQTIGNGIVQDSVSKILEKRTEATIVAYSIEEGKKYSSIYVLFLSKYKFCDSFNFKRYDYWHDENDLEDRGLKSDQYGLGINLVDLEKLSHLKSFYLSVKPTE